MVFDIFLHILQYFFIINHQNSKIKHPHYFFRCYNPISQRSFSYVEKKFVIHSSDNAVIVNDSHSIC